MSITDEQIAEIEALAIKSQQSKNEPWFSKHGLAYWMLEEDANYVSCASPEFVLSLIARLREAERWKADASQVLNPLLDYAHSLGLAKLGHSVTDALIEDHKRLREAERDTPAQPEVQRLREALAMFVHMAESRLQELGDLSPEMAECLNKGRAALLAQQSVEMPIVYASADCVACEGNPEPINNPCHVCGGTVSVAQSGVVQRLLKDCEYLANENIELKMLIKNMRQQLSISTKQEK